MELEYATGARPDESPYDVNGDGVFSVDDYVDPDGTSGAMGDVTTSGRKSKVGIIPTPAILARPGGDGGGGQLEHKYLSGSSGQVEKVNENPGAGEFGRQSWRQLFR
jgi:type IV pilus assembly protein PilY1